MKRDSIAVVVCLGFLGLVTTPVMAATIAKPNILVIVADDLGWRDVGYHGGEVLTPNLDRLAKGGIRLENHYVWPTCSPTRTALLAGRNPSRFGILGPIDGRSELAVPLGTPTIASVLKAQGYATGLAGKWHLGLRPEVGPRKYGFDSTYGYLHGQIDPDSHLYKNGDTTWHRNDEFTEEQGHATELLAAEAIRFLKEKRRQPFFLYVAFSVPHTPLREDEKWIVPYKEKFLDMSRRLAAASITHMDDAIGRIASALDARGDRDNTIILFTSDNGGQEKNASTNEYGGKFPACPSLSDNRPLRGWKGEVYEGGIRVPAFINWRGHLRPGAVDQTISALDWLPTLAKLTGASVPADAKLDGIDVWPALGGNSKTLDRKLYWKTNRDFALRSGDWKLLELGRDKWELFQVRDDPFEVRDRAASEPGKVAELKALLEAEKAMNSPGGRKKKAK
jgi:arylsulfatase B